MEECEWILNLKLKPYYLNLQPKSRQVKGPAIGHSKRFHYLAAQVKFEGRI